MKSTKRYATINLEKLTSNITKLSHKILNPLAPRRTQVSPFTEISILFLRRDHQKNFLWTSRLWVGRRKEPILGYVPKNDEKKNFVHKGLIREKLHRYKKLSNAGTRM